MTPDRPQELLRNHKNVQVRALVRDAKNAYNGYGRLSYEVGAEDGKMDLRPAWAMDPETGRYAAPATMEFDEAVQGGYGLDRLEIRECELRYTKDVDAALGDVDAVIWCACPDAVATGGRVVLGAEPGEAAAAMPLAGLGVRSHGAGPRSRRHRPTRPRAAVAGARRRSTRTGSAFPTVSTRRREGSRARGPTSSSSGSGRPSSARRGRRTASTARGARRRAGRRPTWRDSPSRSR